MPSFSQRMGYNPINLEIQDKSMNEMLRVDLWNVLYSNCLVVFDNNNYLRDDLEVIGYRYWIDFAHERVDELDYASEVLEHINDVISVGIWHHVYDLVEYILENFTSQFKCTFQFMVKKLNNVLEINNAAYRISGRQVTPIIDDIELSAVDKINELDNKYEPIKEHIRTAISYLSDRQNPDYRNSIKESISAVESLCCIIAREKGLKENTLGAALTALQDGGQIAIHDSLYKGFKKIYHYTCNEDGIRHGIMDEPDVRYEDALYMVVSCSAFTNYLIQKIEPKD